MWIYHTHDKIGPKLMNTRLLMTNKQENNPLHGKTLEHILTKLVDHFGWEKLGVRIKIRCFTSDPSIKSSLKFLRKTAWARKEVEDLFLTIGNKNVWK